MTVTGWYATGKTLTGQDATGMTVTGWYATGVTHQMCLVLWTWKKLANETNAKNAPKIC